LKRVGINESSNPKGKDEQQGERDTHAGGSFRLKGDPPGNKHATGITTDPKRSTNSRAQRFAAAL
jgi:hypothetical protein